MSILTRLWKAIPSGHAVLASLFVALWMAPAEAELRVDITRGSVRAMPIAVTNFIGTGARERDIGRDIAAVIKSDLELSGLFKPIDPKAFIAVETSLDTVPNFQNWSVLNADALAQGRVTLLAGNRIRIKFRLWDVAPQKQSFGQKFTTVASNWRRIAHIISDAIYKRVTGEDGYFDTRIVYIAETGRGDRRIKRLAIMDWDGANHHFLTDG
ncbi:MAG: Tol-Pal system protein TolB, partial [Rhodospirillaceae bacterium]|nr:Tol-Pal system protein TolB [Rhodospirillaceae bacterium]